MTTSYSNRPPPVTALVASAFDKAAYTTYEKVKSERDALKESEHVYKTRINHLEAEAADLLKSYQNIYAENKILKSKVEHGPDSQRIRRFRDEIRRLEDKVSLLNTNNSMLKDEVFALQKQHGQVSDEKKRIDDAFKMERGLHMDKSASLEKENKILEEKVEKNEKEKNEFEFRINNYEEESDGLLNRYKELKRDNLRMEAKFKKQKQQIDEEFSETKTNNKEMAKEIIQLKMKFSKLQAEYNSIKLDNAASEKQIDYMNKELEVYRHQETQLKKNVKQTSKDKMRMEDELKAVEVMLDEARTYGFEAIFEERKNLKRKEQKRLKQNEELEMQIEEITRENVMLERELMECRRKMEAVVMEHQTILYAESAYKRRIETLENANIEFDRQGKFMLAKNKKGVSVVMGDEHVKQIEKEKIAATSKLRFVEGENRRLQRRIKELENSQIDDIEDNINLFSYNSLRQTEKMMMRGEIPPLRSSRKHTFASAKKAKTPRSLPSIDRHN